MAKYKIRVEATEEAEMGLGALANNVMECDGFVLLLSAEDVSRSFIQSLNPTNLSKLFARQPILWAAARAGEALTEIVEAKRANDQTEKYSEFLRGFGRD